MVNWVEVLRKFLGWVAKNAGLWRLDVAVEDAGATVMSFWAPAPPRDDKGATSEIKRTSVVLVHGFAGDGIVTWGLQLAALAKRHDVYVPDLLHFGASSSPPSNRSPAFQAACVAAALRRLGVERCAVVGFSYGSVVAFRMAEAFPGLVRSVVVSGAAVDMTHAMNDALLARRGAGSLGELLLPESVDRLRSLFSAAIHRKLWLPDRLLRDFLEVMFTNRKERGEMLEVTKILPLWGENDDFVTIEMTKKLKEELGEKATLRSISKAGHLVHLERPCVYNRILMEFLQPHCGCV
uniref:AB hydrolase-1 domain-containing protein n=1 Tax=Leersia perrieri TaxID=77586 RepID=A0A0D9WK96_9ORYZ